MEMLVEVNTPYFVAYVTNFNDLPSSKVLPIISEKDSMEQFVKLSELLLECVAPEIVDALKALTIVETAKFVEEWLKTSFEAK